MKQDQTTNEAATGKENALKVEIATITKRVFDQMERVYPNKAAAYDIGNKLYGELIGWVNTEIAVFFIGKVMYGDQTYLRKVRSDDLYDLIVWGDPDLADKCNRDRDTVAKGRMEYLKTTLPQIFAK